MNLFQVEKSACQTVADLPLAHAPTNAQCGFDSMSLPARPGAERTHGFQEAIEGRLRGLNFDLSRLALASQVPFMAPLAEILDLRSPTNFSVRIDSLFRSIAIPGFARNVSLAELDYLVRKNLTRQPPGDHLGIEVERTWKHTVPSLMADVNDRLRSATVEICDYVESLDRASLVALRCSESGELESEPTELTLREMRRASSLTLATPEFHDPSLESRILSLFNDRSNIVASQRAIIVERVAAVRNSP